MSRPLSHPNMDDITVSGILHALADPVRLAIIIESARKGVELASRVRSRELESRFPGLLQSILKAYKRDGVKSQGRRV